MLIFFRGSIDPSIAFLIGRSKSRPLLAAFLSQTAAATSSPSAEGLFSYKP